MVESKFNPGDEVYLVQRVIVRSINFTGIGIRVIPEDNDGDDIGEYPIDNIHEDVSWT